MTSTSLLRPLTVGLLTLGALTIACVGGPGDNTSSGGTSGSSGGTSSNGGTSSSSGTTSTSSSGSSGATPPSRSNYATDCTVASDCVAANFGTDACCAGCDTAAISSKDKARFDADVQKFRATCTSAQPCPAIGCATTQATCSSGRCTLRVCSPTCGDAG
jgi:hypothetical protein